MDVEDLRVAIEVADRRSFAEVARDRACDPSAISRTIAALEAELGIRLFQRTTRTMALTEAGERYLAAIRPAVEALERAGDALASAQGEATGVLRLTTSVAFGETLLAPLLPVFQAAFPRVQLELIITDDNLDLVAERIDLAIRLGPSHRGDVIGVKLFPTCYRVVASPDNLVRDGAVTAPQDLGRRACLLFAAPALRSRWLLRKDGEALEVAVGGPLVSANAVVLRDAALRGLGVALLPDWLIDGDIAQGRLVDVLPAYAATPSSFETAAWLLYPSRDFLPVRARLAIDFFRARFAGLREAARVRRPR